MLRSSMIVMICCAVFLTATWPLFGADLSENGILSEGQPLPNSLIELSYDDKSILSTFEFDGHRVSIETRRGPRTPLALRMSDPKTPLYEIDVRVLDENGVPFVTQVGGHDALHKDWVYSQALVSPPSEALDLEITQRPFQLAKKAIETLQSIEFRSALRPEYQAIISLLPLIEQGLSVELTEDTPDVTRHLAVGSSACTERQKIAVHDAPILLENLPGRHSATVASTISKNGRTYNTWVSCNHGRCPSDMKLKCSWTSGANRCGICEVSPLCATPYDALSRKGKHNCNDDTYIQYQRIRDNVNPSITGGKCSDSSMHNSFSEGCW